MNIYNLRFEDEMNKAVEDEIICNNKYCPWHIEYMSSPNNPTCEGRYCEQAFMNYMDMLMML